MVMNCRWLCCRIKQFKTKSGFGNVAVSSLCGVNLGYITSLLLCYFLLADPLVGLCRRFLNVLPHGGSCRSQQCKRNLNKEEKRGDQKISIVSILWRSLFPRNLTACI